MEKTSQNYESDSDEQTSTNEDVESSQQWTTDFDDHDSDTEGNSGDASSANHVQRHKRSRHRHYSDVATDQTDSNEEDEDIETDRDDYTGSDSYDSDYRHRSGIEPTTSAQEMSEKCMDKHQFTKGGKLTGKIGRNRSVNSAELKENFDKSQVQSDTETRNLLDDVGDFDEDYMDLQETFVNAADHQHNSPLFDPALFDLCEEQYDYYANCFLYLLEKTQGHVQVDGSLNGADMCIVDFFRKSHLDNGTLSRVWALADVNEDGFLNLTEFIVAMHIIVLHLKADVAIPTSLPAIIRPPATPVRQLIRLANGNLATIPVDLRGNCPTKKGENEQQSGSTTTTSAASSSNSATNFAAAVGTETGTTNLIGTSDGASSRGSNNSNYSHQLYQYNINYQQGQLHSQKQQVATHPFSSVSGMSTSLELKDSSRNAEKHKNGGYELMNNSHVSYASYAETSQDNAAIQRANLHDVQIGVDFTDTALYSSSSGVKQHSLSDDHLHLYAQQRDIGMANFSDVPPVLVDSHPTALNALTTPLALFGGGAITSSRGPPPQPPPRDYTAGTAGGKGHGRSASLDLKTFSALSPSYPPKSSHSNYRLPSWNAEIDEQTAQKTHPQQLETLREDYGHLSKILKEQSTQTKLLGLLTMDALSTDYEGIFTSPDVYENLPTTARCELLKRLNDELESERMKLAQIRLQLQLRVEETEQEFFQQVQIQAKDSVKLIANNNKASNQSESSGEFTQPSKPTAL